MCCLSEPYRCGICDIFILCRPLLSVSLCLFPSTTDCFSLQCMLNISTYALAHFDTPESYRGCMLSPLSLSLCLSSCHMRTIIDRGKIKRRTCGLNVIWFTVDLYLEQSTMEQNFTEGKPSINSRKWHPHCIKRACLLAGVWMSVCTCIINIHHSIFLLLPSASLHLQVSHLFICYVRRFSVCVCVPHCVMFACMIPWVIYLFILFFSFWTNKDDSVLLCAAASPQGCSLPCPNNSRAGCVLQSPEESAQMSGWCHVLKRIMINVIWHRQVLYTQANVQGSAYF